jgi:hypothetical protein
MGDDNKQKETTSFIDTINNLFYCGDSFCGKCRFLLWVNLNRIGDLKSELENLESSEISPEVFPLDVTFVLNEIKREYNYDLNWEVLKNKLTGNYYKEKARRVGEEKSRILAEEKLINAEEEKFKGFEEEILSHLDEKELKVWRSGKMMLKSLQERRLRIIKDDTLCRKERRHVLSQRLDDVDKEKSQILEERVRILGFLETLSLENE